MHRAIRLGCHGFQCHCRQTALIDQFGGGDSGAFSHRRAPARIDAGLADGGVQRLPRAAQPAQQRTSGHSGGAGDFHQRDVRDVLAERVRSLQRRVHQVLGHRGTCLC
ncbi:Uncharacterised protein [Mycobacteroides abscessus subsp. abscessus]|nr:Uncharacterised protein [Mycobacteroides abscessus subsp. abscessus]